jgi:hypothetical protein
MAYKSELLYEREYTCDYGDFVNGKDLYGKISKQISAKRKSDIYQCMLAYH